jgi:hypothetical protein
MHETSLGHETLTRVERPGIRRVGILVFDEGEVLDLGGPFEVFATASRVARRLQPDAPAPFEVTTLSRDG